MFYANARLRVKKNSVTHIQRFLVNARGKIKVSVGQEVFPEVVLAEGQVSGGFRTIRLAGDLGVNPSQAESLLSRPLGQIIYQGELLAVRKGFFGTQQKIILSPVDGVLDVYDKKSGNLKLRLLPKLSKLVSGVYGIVDRVDEAKNLVMIRSFGTVVHGVLGSGRSREGLLEILASREMLVSSKQILPSQQGRIVVGGGLVFLDALEKTMIVGVSGIISGGINAPDYLAMSGGAWNIRMKKWADVGVGLLVTEGFGSVPLGEDIYDILREHNEHFVILEGTRGRLILPSTEPDCLKKIRETKISLPDEEMEGSLQVITLQVGLKVRLLSASFLGNQGVIESIDQSATLLPSGLSTVMVTVVSSNRKLRVPYTNLEVLKEE
ncbi:MAG: hypothetical protein Q7S44_03175 [bacterium]|nr:hypothetical protein [bacterium]